MDYAKYLLCPQNVFRPVSVLVFSIGLMANILCLLVFRRLGLQKPINLLFSALATLDILGIFFELLNLVIGYFTSAICYTQATPVFFIVSRHLSHIFLRSINPMITLFIAFTRFSALAEITQINLNSMLKRTKYILTGISISAVVFYIPFMTVYKISEASKGCFKVQLQQSVFSDTFLAVYQIIIYSIFFISLTTFSVLMLRVLYIARKRTNEQNISSTHNKASYIIITILFFSIFTFILTWLISLSLFDIINFHTNEKTELLYLLLYLLYNINNVVNIFIHSMHKKFRENLKHIVFQCRSTSVQRTRETEEIELKVSSPPS